jgi:hypothetical protein
MRDFQSIGNVAMMAHRFFPHAAIVAGLTSLPALIAAWTALAQPAGQPAVEPPEIGEIMMFQQLRHAKLWFAGKAGNWPLAAYEVKELREGFETVSKYYPTFNNVPLATMIDAIRDANFTELDNAVAAHDRAKFARAFDGLSQACNACHQASELGFISIRRPTAPPFSNQSYAPRK